MKRRTQGFTLVELLVVIAIIGILATLMVPLSRKGTKSAQTTKASQEVRFLMQAVTEYYADHSFMPVTSSKKLGNDTWVETSDKEWMAVLQGDNAKKKNYLSGKTAQDGVLLDPWGHAYLVGMDRDLDRRVKARTGNKSAPAQVVVISCGPDGEYGNDDDISTGEFQ